MTPFNLHKQIEADSFPIRSLSLCQIRLQNQQSVPWLVLVPCRDGLTEIHQLSTQEQSQLIQEITQASRVLQKLYNPDKINVGALGNIVPQLHIHVIGRFKNDPAWPGPVWGNLAPHPYTAETIEATKTKLNEESLWRA